MVGKTIFVNTYKKLKNNFLQILNLERTTAASKILLRK